MKTSVAEAGSVVVDVLYNWALFSPMRTPKLCPTRIHNTVETYLLCCEHRVQELRDRQAMAEKSALEAKRARVLEDMKRRQQRLQRLQEEEG